MENIVRKGEIACNKQFLLFLRFLFNMLLTLHFECTLKCRLQSIFNLDQCKVLSSGNGLSCMIPRKSSGNYGFIKPILYNSLPNDKILDGSKLKAFADNEIK